MAITAVDSVTQKPQAGKEVDKNKAAEYARLKKACEQFESLFIYYMLKTMRSASEQSSLLDDGLGSNMFTQLFDEGLADKMAESSPFGIGDNLMRTYAKMAGLSEEDYKTYDSITAQPSYKRIFIKTKDNKTENTPQNIEINKYNNIISQASIKHNLNPELLKAVILQESGGDTTAVSSKGAKGLMQLMDGTARMLGVSDPFDPEENINGGAKYLSSLIKKFDGNIDKALAAYNAGPGTVEKYNGIPPYEETKNYVTRILDKVGDSSKLTKSR